MGTSQRFCLRWNNHQSNLLSVFDQLLHDEAFVDVTLAVEGQFLRAHKMVLSACSPYFQSLFVGHPDRHPIVILKDVPYADMRSLLDFMYRGEVSVDQERLTAFLKVAESLRIKGLTEVNEERCDLPSLASSLLSNTSTAPPPPNLHRIHPMSHSHKRVLAPMVANPLLGSALTAPKRKRGRPRKLSGSSNGPNTPGEPINLEDEINEHEMRLHHPNRPDSPTMGPPDLLEVNMGDSEQNPTLNQENEMGPEITNQQPDDADIDEIDEVDEKPIKQEPTPSTSTQDSTFSDKNSKDGDPFSPENQTVLRLNVGEEVSITTEPMSELDQTSQEEVVITPVAVDPHDQRLTPVQSLFASGVHFLSHDSLTLLVPKQEPLDDPEDSNPGRRDLLEYLIQDDGSVVCKWCGEVLPSRTHWYRHKYKFHVQAPPNTASLFKCYRCNVFFKSRKGYHGHITSRHSGVDKKPNVKDENDTTIKSGFKELETTPTRARRSVKQIEDIPVEEYEKQREKEEKLVAEIIEKVKRECEAQGSTVSRRGYTRRQTVMNT